MLKLWSSLPAHPHAHRSVHPRTQTFIVPYIHEHRQSLLSASIYTNTHCSVHPCTPTLIIQCIRVYQHSLLSASMYTDTHCSVYQTLAVQPKYKTISKPILAETFLKTVAFLNSRTTRKWAKRHEQQQQWATLFDIICREKHYRFQFQSLFIVADVQAVACNVMGNYVMIEDRPCRWQCAEHATMTVNKVVV